MIFPCKMNDKMNHRNRYVGVGGLELVDPESALLNPIYCGQKWARVSEQAVRKTRRNAYANNKKLQKLSERAKVDIHRNFNIEHIIDKLVNDLERIRIKNKNSDVFIKRSGWHIVMLNEIRVNIRYNINYFITYRSLRLMLRTLKLIFWKLNPFLSKRQPYGKLLMSLLRSSPM